MYTVPNSAHLEFLEVRRVLLVQVLHVHLLNQGYLGVQLHQGTLLYLLLLLYRGYQADL